MPDQRNGQIKIRLLPKPTVEKQSYFLTISYEAFIPQFSVIAGNDSTAPAYLEKRLNYVFSQSKCA